MVAYKKRFPYFYLMIFLWCLLAPGIVFLQEVKISAEIEGKGVSGKPVSGLLTISHGKQTKIDEASFTIGGKELEAHFFKQMRDPDQLGNVLSIYRFSLPPQTPGLYILPPIGANIGGKRYDSVQGTFEVGEGQRSREGKRASEKTPIILGLEQVLEGDLPLYPGQKITAGYRFLYNFSIDLTKEELPLLKVEGFEKIGAKEVNQTKEGETNIFEVKQTMQAVRPGDYSIAPGIIQGRAYRLDSSGKKEVAKTESRAETPGLTLTVLPFPDADKPPSFNGALGSRLDLKVALLSANHITVGDTIQLLIEISGEGEFDTIPLPTLCCQPGFSGFFKLNDLPPIETITESKKTFRVEMRPLVSSVQAIPALEFSYFNPKEQKYHTVRSDPIPLQVDPLKKEEIRAAEPASRREPSPIQEAEGVESAPGLDAIEIAGNYPLKPQNLENLPFGSWKVLFLIPLGWGLIFLQLHMKRYLDAQQQQIPKINSQQLFNEAMRYSFDTPRFFNLVQEAFMLRLLERGEITDPSLSPDYLPSENAPGKVKALIREIEEKRFAGGASSFDDDFRIKITTLFDELYQK